MTNFDYLVFITPLLETVEGDDPKLHLLTVLQSVTQSKEVVKAVQEMRFCILNPVPLYAEIDKQIVDDFVSSLLLDKFL